MDAVALSLFFGAVALFATRAWRPRGRISARDRWSLVTGLAVEVTAFVAAPALINWVVVPAALWLVAVALLAGGVVGAALRWPDLAWSVGTRPVRRAVGVGATLVGCALIVGLVLA
jgi:hypothetical protein